ncbi:hypothetical protein JOE11_004618 [Robbsia andropogonis]
MDDPEGGACLKANGLSAFGNGVAQGKPVFTRDGGVHCW